MVVTVTNPAATETKHGAKPARNRLADSGAASAGQKNHARILGQARTEQRQRRPETDEHRTVPSYYGVSASERGEGKETYFKEKILYRGYKGPSAQLTATVALPVLKVTKTAVTPSVIAGEKDSYTIAVQNTGSSVAHEVQVLDTLPRA